VPESLKPSLARGTTLEQLIRRPEVSLKHFEPLLRSQNVWFSQDVRRSAEIDIRYAGYIEQQKRDGVRLQSLSSRRIPKDLDYTAVDGLSREARERLSKVRPLDLGMATRIPGITPAAISALSIYLEMRRSKRKKASSAL
jgi:tRNA uridine 5-carboxymethylaminomethyl modification enzyme